ncbi:hypothetical protein [Bacillus thuringiensis]|uniref:hypothetical protein n=1 Tax=Bacillus thuringiensis TaxID=1428 RepID=UPI001C54F714|nr:hypothetical protein [Bacillus thuringiensis]
MMGLVREDFKQIVKNTEIKRIAENLSKKELCNVFKINYNYYNNCATMRDSPSPQMVQVLNEYLETPTTTVYKMVFAYRSSDTFVGGRNSDKFIQRDGKWKEKFHRATGIEEGQYEEYVREMRENGIFID